MHAFATRVFIINWFIYRARKVVIEKMGDPSDEGRIRIRPCAAASYNPERRAGLVYFEGPMDSNGMTARMGGEDSEGGGGRRRVTGTYQSVFHSALVSGKILWHGQSAQLLNVHRPPALVVQACVAHLYCTRLLLTARGEVVQRTLVDVQRCGRPRW